ncbi:hypothetical protein BH23BAC1_BH23BAC1_28130 [soil metagenome]
MVSFIINIVLVSILFFHNSWDKDPISSTSASPTEVEDKIYYVHSGEERGKGTLEQPWNLKQAHEEFVAMIKGGDRLKHLPGIYKGKWNSKMQGKPEKPIICEPADYNDPPVFMSDNSKSIKEVHGQTFHSFASHTWYVNFIFKDEHENRISKLDWYKDKAEKDVYSHDMVYISGVSNFKPSGIKLINCMIYDISGVGLFVSEKSANVEIYGNLIALNGFESEARGHGPGTYMRNLEGLKLIENNIVFGNHQLGLRVYGHAHGFRFLNNVTFSNGTISAKNKGDANLFIGGSGNSKIIDNIYCEGNIAYHEPSINRPVTRIGYRGLIKRVDLINESYIGNKPIQIDKNFPPQNPTEITYNNIKYEMYDEVKVVKNKYEKNSAHVTVLNKSGKNGINVDLSGVIEKGTKIVIIDTQNFKGKPIREQEYKGGNIFLPLDLTVASQPFGIVSSKYVHTPKEFNCFIIRAVDRNNSLIINQIHN